MRGIFDGLITMLLVIALVAPLGAHVAWCIAAADRTGSAIALLIAGLVITPLGWLHGVSVFLGFGWI